MKRSLRKVSPIARLLLKITSRESSIRRWYLSRGRSSDRSSWGIAGGVLFSPVGLICITVTSSFGLSCWFYYRVRERGPGWKKGDRGTGPSRARFHLQKQPRRRAARTLITIITTRIPRVTRGPPPRIRTALNPAYYTPTTRDEHWLATRRERIHRRVAFPRLNSGATTQPDCGPSGFRSKFSHRASTAQRAHHAASDTRSRDPPAVILNPVDQSIVAGSSLRLFAEDIELPEFDLLDLGEFPSSQGPPSYPTASVLGGQAAEDAWR